MGDVIDLEERRRKREENTPHGVYHAVCRACIYLWIAVAPDGGDEDTFECPKCHKFRGSSLPKETWDAWNTDRGVDVT